MIVQCNMNFLLGVGMFLENDFWTPLPPGLPSPINCLHGFYMGFVLVYDFWTP